MSRAVRFRGVRTRSPLFRGKDRRARGGKRPWFDRKSDHLAALREAPAAARAIVLADKLHNLTSIDIDLREGLPVWTEFHAGRDQVLWYYHASIAVCDGRFPGLPVAATRGLLPPSPRGDRDVPALNGGKPGLLAKKQPCNFFASVAC